MGECLNQGRDVAFQDRCRGVEKGSDDYVPSLMARSCDGIVRGGFEAALAGEEGYTGHDQEDAQPTDGGDRFVKDEDGGEETEDVADAEQWVGQGEVVVAKDVEPE